MYNVEIVLLFTFCIVYKSSLTIIMSRCVVISFHVMHKMNLIVIVILHHFNVYVILITIIELSVFLYSTPHCD